MTHAYDEKTSRHACMTHAYDEMKSRYFGGGASA